MPIFLIPDDELIFPHPSQASAEGILAVGGDLSPDRLILAYRFGIFPWYNEDEPVLWWSPDPRLILHPENIRVSKSMKSLFAKRIFDCTVNRDFKQVIHNCASVARKGQTGTWINSEMIAAYQKLHRLGYAHSIEVWHENRLVGGIYGLIIGQVFFGESMFSLMSNASKYGFIWWVQKLGKLGFRLVDCQQETNHLKSLGAHSISRIHFLKLLKKWTISAVPLDETIFPDRASAH